MSNIRSAVAIKIAQREAVGRSLSVAELDLRDSGSGVQEDGGSSGNVADDNVRTSIEIQITGGKGVRNAGPILKSEAFPEVALSVVGIHDHQRRGLVADDQIQIAIVIEVGGRRHARCGAARPKRKDSSEIRLAVIEVNPALAAVTFGDGKVDVAVVIKIGSDDAGRGTRRNR